MLARRRPRPSRELREVSGLEVQVVSGMRRASEGRELVGRGLTLHEGHDRVEHADRERTPERLVKSHLREQRVESAPLLVPTCNGIVDRRDGPLRRGSWLLLPGAGVCRRS